MSNEIGDRANHSISFSFHLVKKDTIIYNIFAKRE